MRGLGRPPNAKWAVDPKAEKRSSQSFLIVFLTGPSFEQPLEADILFSAHDDAQAIVKRLCSYQEKRAT
jgi:hypothetical protein